METSSERPLAVPGARPAPPGSAGEAAPPAAASGPGLSRSRLIAAVIAQNPDVEARRQALRAARARRAQVSALDDPELSYSFAPMSIASERFGQTVELSQRLPWPGKRGNLGRSAESEADAAQADVRAAELELALEASLAFDDYWLVDRQLEVNVHHRHLLSDFERTAESVLKVGAGSLQDPLQARVELARLEADEVNLGAARAVAIAELNSLLHRPSGEPLPAPLSSERAIFEPPPPEATLVREALGASPELRALAARARAAEASGDYARREYYPDLTLMVSYSTMYMPEDRLMIGASTPLPLQRGRRGAAVEEFDARALELRSESARLADRLRARVRVARERVLAGLKIVKLHDQRLVPAANAQVSTARTELAAGRTSFVAVLDAERSLRDVELSRWAAIAELNQWRARLDRAAGRVAFAGAR
ncbi:MAG: TolC family protein [Polyangiaceae bacterium]|nr:TolC family protein [Polyangiaceae bacterium]